MQTCQNAVTASGIWITLEVQQEQASVFVFLDALLNRYQRQDEHSFKPKP